MTANTSVNLEQRVIKKFYGRFKAEHAAFLKSIDGISDDEQLQSYATVTLSRLMFVYFIQSKGFLSADYLRRRLIESKARGKNRFYLDVVRPLFFDGFASGQGRRRPALKEMARAPHLETGPTPLDKIEQARGIKAHIPDCAFERAIDFFDQYHWRLDERHLSRDDEINTEVLGYILERHINQRQLGAYYTKEDVTGYIGRNTIIPSLFDAARRIFKGAFEEVCPAWLLLRADPDRYIYPSLKKGAELPLPDAIRARFDAGSPPGRASGPAPSAHGSPGESWREVLARRAHYEQVRARLARGEIRSVNGLITNNLDAVRFAQDAIESCESARTLAAFWQALEKITVLDPTCGSGAFLFAALKILEPLYGACLERMQALLSEPGWAGGKHISKEFKGFQEILRRAGPENSSDRHYFILKSIIRSNLFGVDLMEEAVEICKLRLSLKLLARLEPGDSAPGDSGPGDLGPEDRLASLLDIDFNIRAGNALVGFVSCETAGLGEQARTGLHNKREALKEALDSRLTREYAIEPGDKEAYEKWLASHKPFHWAVEFGEPVKGGGFDVVIGNPPYVSASKARRRYSVRGYQTGGCPDVYAWTMERACDLLRQGGRTGMIVPLSLSFSGDLNSCRELLFSRDGENWFSSFARIPAALFSFDVRVRNTIHIGHKTGEAHAQHTTRLHRWFESARPHLFDLLQYAPFTPERWRNRIPKFSANNLALAFEKALAQTRSTLASSLSSAPTPYALRFKKTAYNWLNFCRDLPPCYGGDGSSVPHTKFGSVYFEDERTRDLAFLLLNGKLAFAFWCVVGDDFDVTRWMFAEFPIDLRSLADCAQERLLGLAGEMEELMARNLSFKLNAGRRVGNYNLAKCREVTDKSDRVFAEHLGFQDAWADIELMYEQIVKTDFNDDPEG
ncbi:MAG TPA: DNA methyltransferase [Blastocatellia bacterium]